MWSKAMARYFPVQTSWFRGQWRGGEGFQGLLVVGFYSSFPPEPLAKCLIILHGWTILKIYLHIYIYIYIYIYIERERERERERRGLGF